VVLPPQFGFETLGVGTHGQVHADDVLHDALPRDILDVSMVSRKCYGHTESCLQVPIACDQSVLKCHHCYHDVIKCTPVPVLLGQLLRRQEFVGNLEGYDGE
jgi:hypothetical protein